MLVGAENGFDNAPSVCRQSGRWMSYVGVRIGDVSDLGSKIRLGFQLPTGLGRMLENMN